MFTLPRIATPFALALLGLSAASCTFDEPQGSLTVPLTFSSANTDYKSLELVGGEVRVVGPETRTFPLERQDGDGFRRLDLDLAPGTYHIELTDDWQLVGLSRDGTTTPVDAQLLGPNPIEVTLAENGALTPTFYFLAEDRVVELDGLFGPNFQGTLHLESSTATTGSDPFAAAVGHDVAINWLLAHSESRVDEAAADGPVRSYASAASEIFFFQKRPDEAVDFPHDLLNEALKGAPVEIGLTRDSEDPRHHYIFQPLKIASVRGDQKSRVELSIDRTPVRSGIFASEEGPPSTEGFSIDDAPVTIRVLTGDVETARATGTIELFYERPTLF